MSHPPWERYVAWLCLDAWALDPASLIKVMGDIEALVASNDVTDASIETVLRMGGVPGAEADRLAPSIRHAIEGESGNPPPPSPP